MEIKILGTGCSSCKQVYERAIEAVSELGIEATVIKEEDMIKIMSYNVLSLPAMVVDGKVVFSGKKPSVAEIKGYISK